MTYHTRRWIALVVVAALLGALCYVGGFGLDLWWLFALGTMCWAAGASVVTYRLESRP